MTDVAEPTTELAANNLRWYQGVPRYAWVVLALACLGWMFDTFDQQIFTLVRIRSLQEMIAPSHPANLDATVKEVGGQLTTVFLLGWAAGGFLFGIVGDKLGRARTMVITILTYAIFTGLNAFARNPMEYGACRFLTAMGVGGEFAAGAALVSEVWPNRSRPMALGYVQALSAVGNIFAALTTLALASLSWRWVFIVGAAPALIVFGIMRFVKEPEKWQEAKRAAEEDGARRQLGSIASLFADPALRRNTIAGVLLASAGVGGAWGVGFFSPELITGAFRHMVEAAGTPKDQVKAVLQQWSSLVFLTQMVGAGIGMVGYAALSERIGRKKAMAIVFVAAFIALQLFFGVVRSPATAFPLAFLLGLTLMATFSAYAVYFPELYPTRVRATGVGFCYNSARVVAAFAPLALGNLAAHFADPSDITAGLRRAASIVAFVLVLGLIGLAFAPETKGKPLPE